MKITMAAGEFNGLVQAVESALDAKPNIGWMGGVLLEAKDGKIHATATCGTITMRTSKDCEVYEDGAALIDGKMLCQFAAKLPEGIVTLEAQEGKNATIKCKGSKTTLSLLPHEDFAKPSSITPKVKLTVDAQKLRWILKGVQYAVAVSESRAVLTGVLLSAKGGRLIAVGLDGFRMAAYKSECEVDGAAELIVHMRGAKEILKMASKTTGNIELESDGNKIRVANGDTELIAALIAGEYINYKQILPSASKTIVRANVKDVYQAVERAMLMEDKNSLVRFEVANNQITIQGRGESGETIETVECNVQGDDIRAAFNGKYLKECLSVMEDEEILFAMNTPTTPVVVKPVDGDGYIHLVLPVRTQETA